MTCFLLFVVMTINYIDRNALSVPKTTLQRPVGAVQAATAALGLGVIGAALLFAGWPRTRHASIHRLVPQAKPKK